MVKFISYNKMEVMRGVLRLGFKLYVRYNGDMVRPGATGARSRGSPLQKRPGCSS